MIASILSQATTDLQGIVGTVRQLAKFDQGRRAITAQRADLQKAKQQVAAATQTTYKALNQAAAGLVGTPHSGHVVGLLQQAANSQPSTRRAYPERSFVRP